MSSEPAALSLSESPLTATFRPPSSCEDELQSDEYTALALEGTVLCQKWRVDRLLGIGGMAAVYSATHRNGHRAAMKVLHPEFAAIDEVRERFLKESYTANLIEHPGVVTIRDECTADDGTIFLILDLLRGETLAAKHARGALTLPEILRSAQAVLDVLAAAHERGIVHRDIKPDNLFVTEAGDVKVLDFGIAWRADIECTLVQRPGTTVGTPGFIAPEQARGALEHIDGRADLWSLGATLFYFMTGRYVREAGSLEEELAAAMTSPVVDVRSVEPSVPLVIADVIDRALAFDKEHRFANAREMAAAIARASAWLDEGEGNLNFHSLRTALAEREFGFALAKVVAFGRRRPRMIARTLLAAAGLVATSAVATATFPTFRAGSSAAPPRAAAALGPAHGPGENTAEPPITCANAVFSEKVAIPLQPAPLATTVKAASPSALPATSAPKRVLVRDPLSRRK